MNDSVTMTCMTADLADLLVSMVAYTKFTYQEHHGGTLFLTPGERSYWESQGLI